MASFFGEISALSSRAVDDEEIDDLPTYNLKIDPESKSVGNTDCKLLIFSVGDLATAFSKCYLIPDNHLPLMNIKYASDKAGIESNMYTGGLLSPSKGLQAATIYAVNADVVVCEIAALIPEEINMDLCETILNRINCLEALVLTSRHMANFKSTESLQSETPFLKALATSQYVASYTYGIPALQAPNFLSGFSAALLAEFQVKRKPALCVVNYVDSNLLDSLNVQTFEKIREGSFSVKLHFVGDTKAKLLKYIKAKRSTESNLYT